MIKHGQAYTPWQQFPAHTHVIIDWCWVQTNKLSTPNTRTNNNKL